MNCSTDNSSQTKSDLIKIAGYEGVVSGVTCLVALCWLFYLKLYKQFLYRLAAYQVVASLFHALLLVSQFPFLEYNDSKYQSCEAVGYLFLMVGWMKVCFGFWVTFHLFCFAVLVLLKNMRKLEPLYVISSILFPIAISSIPLITKSFGPTGEWCWIQNKKRGTRNVAGEVEQIAVWYGPLFVVLLVQSIAMLVMMVTVYYRAHRKSDDTVFGREQHKKAFRQLLPLVAYPILFCVLVVPTMISRVYGFASPTPNKDVALLPAIFIPSWSFFAGITVIVHIGVVKCADVKTCLHVSAPLSFLCRRCAVSLRRRPESIPVFSNTERSYSYNATV